MDKSLPVYKITANGNDEGIEAVAFVSNPAIVTKGLAFETQKLHFADQKLMRVIAPAIIPMNIYRFSDDIGEYEAQFTVEAIEDMYKDLMKRNSLGQNKFNLDHNSDLQSPAYILEAWMVRNPETDPAFTEFGIEGLKKGSIMLVAQITDAEYFQKEIIEKERTGFSIEGLFGLKMSSIKNQIKNQMEKNTTPTPMEEMKLSFAELLAEIKALKAETKVEIKAEVTEEVKAEEVPVADAPVEKAAPSPADEKVATLEAKVDDLMKIVAELKSKVEGTEAPVEAQEPVKQELSSVAALLSFAKYSRSLQED